MGKEPVVDFGFRKEGDAPRAAASAPPPAPPKPPAPQFSERFRSKAEQWKRSLLDVTRRNRGINFKPSRSTLKLPALSADLWDTLLVNEGGASFDARNFAPDAPSPAEDNRAKEAFDAARRLVERARLADREQGIQVLFAALGWLSWVDSDGHQLRSPLVLIPITLQYDRQDQEVRLDAASDDPPEVNPSLAYLLAAQYGLRLPELENDEDGTPIHASFGAFLDAARAVVAKQVGWLVEEGDPVVDVFAFAKLAMVDEIDHSLARLANHPLLQRMAGDAPIEPPPEEDPSPLDERYPPGALHTVVDADAYQLQAVAWAAEGRSFVIEGPPGTGKSQTITNIIAELLSQGKRILFVAEKRVAREVVLDNLSSAGLAEAALHLAANANTANRADAKAQVIKEIIDTLDAGPPPPAQDAALPDRYAEMRNRLNAYANAIGQPLGEGGWTTVYEVIGTAEQLRANRSEVPIPPIAGKTRFWLDDVMEEARSLDAFKAAELAPMAGPWAALRWTNSDAARAGELKAMLDRLAPLPGRVAEHAAPVLPAGQEASALTVEGIRELAGRLEKVAAFRKKAGSFLRFVNPGYYSAKGDYEKYLADGYRETKAEGAAAKGLRAIEAELSAAAPLLADAFGPDAPLAATAAEQSGWAEALLRDFDALPVLAEIAAILANLERMELRPAATGILADTANHGRVEARLLASIYAGWAAQTLTGELALTPAQHERLAASFVRLDKEMIGWSRGTVLGEVRARRPRSVNHSAMAPLVKYHRAKRRPSLRAMLGNSRDAVQILKPCLLMSPLAAAQYLCHGPEKTFTFDAVIADEASMIPTADMVVALSLAPQAIIVGDSKQMPPTNFFNKEIAPTSDEEEEDVTFESILDEAAPIIPSTMLRAHYRSRDESLIAFSNVHFYDGRLIAFPDAWGIRPESGVRFEFVQDAVYGRGGSRANTAEAQRTIEVLRRELEASNFGRHVAVTAMSLAQQQEILKELEQAASIDAVVRRWLDEGGLVRNLETVQGDESDVMVLSVGYGKDADGRLFLNFGPLGQEKGERRLNVAVTRAKWKTVVVSSIRSSDIDPARTSSTGTLRLRDYLDYAERGPVALPEVAANRASAVGAFEKVVIAALEANGLRCVPSVGVGGYRVDIAVAHPDDRERFVLAVQCDGPSYYTAPACRDRDLGHPFVLGRMGWKTHRVFSPAWYREPEAELARVLDAYKAAL